MIEQQVPPSTCEGRVDDVGDHSEAQQPYTDEDGAQQDVHDVLKRLYPEWGEQFLEAEDAAVEEAEYGCHHAAGDQDGAQFGEAAQSAHPAA